MTSSSSDFKSRQQYELERFNEFWSAASSQTKPHSDELNKNSLKAIQSTVELAANIFSFSIVGLHCYKSNFDYVCKDRIFSDLNAGTEGLTSFWKERSENADFFRTNDFQSTKLSYSNIWENVPPETSFFYSVPILVRGRVEAFFFLADAEKQTLSEEKLLQIKYIVTLFESIIPSGEQLASLEEFAKINTQMVRLKAIVEGATGEIFVLSSRDQKLIVSNLKARENLGYSDAELFNDLVFMDFCGVDHEELDERISELLSEKIEKASFQTNFKRKDGSEYPVLLELSIDKNGPEIVLVAFARDISIRLQHQSDLEELAAHHQAALSVALEMGLGMQIVCDSDGEISDFIILQAELGKFTSKEYNEEKLVGSRFLETFPTSKTNGLFERCVEVFHAKKLLVFEQEYNAEGIDEWFRVSALRVGNSNLQVGLRTITESKRRDAALIKLHELSADLEISTDEYLQGMLSAGRAALGMKYAQFSDVDNGDIVVRHVLSDVPCIGVGARMPLSDTIFSKRDGLKEPLFLKDANFPHTKVESSEWDLIRAYAAAPITSGGTIKSYVSFMSNEAKENSFEEFEIGIISLIAKLISQRISLEDARRKLETSRDELQLIFDNVPARMWRKDKNHRYLKVNKPAAELLNTLPEDLIGKSPTDYFAKLEEINWKDLDEEAFRTGKPFLGLELEGGLGAGSWESIDIIPVKGENVENEGWLIISTDLSKQKATENKLASVVEELETANKHLEQFNAVVSHDLKAPLRHMRMLSELLVLSVEANSESAEYAEHIRENAEHGQAMIDALNALSRVSHVDLNARSTNINDVVSSIVAVLSEEISEIGGTIECDDLPTLQVDSELVSNLFQNLIENSIKYRSDAPLKISVEVQKMNGKHIFAVKDNGRGIVLSENQDIFQIFTRLQGGDDKLGEGVGLSICRRIVERHGGKIWLDQEYTDGACFKFTLSDSQ